MSVEISVGVTRNENFLHFATNRELVPKGTGLSFPDSESAQDFGLVKDLFEIDGVASVWVIGNDVQVTKEENVRWSSIKSKVMQTIKRHLD